MTSMAIQAAPLLEVRDLDVDTPAGRPLIRGLCLTLGRERLAIIGRNGGGKSSLLATLAGERDAARGVVIRRGSVLLVPQELPSLETPELSAGERRKLFLQEAERARPDLLLLDEPSQDLDQAGCVWLRQWLSGWRGAVVLVSHDRSLLRGFSDFMLLAEAGCRHVSGDLHEVERQALRDEDDHQRSYAQRLQVLVQKERHSEQFRKRRGRKKATGRLRELARRTPRARLNLKRMRAQENQGRIEGLRAARLAEVRSWAKSARRALSVTLPLTEAMPELGPVPESAIILLEQVAGEIAGRRLFSGLDLELRRERVAVTGKNGAGKTTLLRTMLGEHPAAEGRVRTRRERIGVIAQGGSDWASEESLLERLHLSTGEAAEALGLLLAAHRFPLALAARPMASLSPGERVRAALICLMERRPAIDVLLLDEPTYGLDFVGWAALRDLLAAWAGGLVVVSHDRELLDAIRIEKWIELSRAHPRV